MSLFPLYRSKKYLRKTIASISLLVLLILVVFSVALYSRSEKIVLDMQKDANLKVLSQIKFNVSYMDDVIQKLTTSLYYDNDVIPLMTAGSSSDFFSDYVRRSRIDKFADYTPFIHSILIYNANTDKFTWGGDPSIQNRDSPIYAALRAKFKSEEPLPKLQMIPMSLDGSADRIDFFSIFDYDSIGYRPGQSVFVLNVKPQWVFDNIRLINGLAWQENESVFLIGKDGRALSPDANAPVLDEGLKAAVLAHSLASGEEGSAFFHSVNGQKKVVNTLNTGVNDWTLVSLQSYGTLVRQANALKNASIVLTAAFLLLALFATLGVSHRLYRPVGRLVHAVRRDSGEDPATRAPHGDEISYVSSVYREAIDRLRVASNERISTRNIVRDYSVRKLLTDSATLSSEQVAGLIGEHRLAIRPNGPYVVCVLKLDGSDRTEAALDERKLLHFAIANVAQEIVSERIPCEAVEMRSEHVAVILSLSGYAGPDDPAAWLREAFGRVQQIFSDLYRASFSVAIGEEAAEFEGLSDAYGRGLEYLRYAFVFGPRSIIDAERIRPNLAGERQAVLPSDLEKKLVESIRARQDEAFEKTLERIMAYISTLNHDYMIYMALHVLILMKNVIREMNDNRLVPLPINHTDANLQIVNSRSLEDIRGVLAGVYREIGENGSRPEHDRNDVLVETVRAVIEQNFADYNLSLQSVAEVLKLSPDYIGKLFKKQQGMSVAEYINEVRLRQAVHYLEQGDYTVNELIEKIGIGNRGNFFRLFKLKYGTTPKDYRTKKSIDQN